MGLWGILKKMNLSKRKQSMKTNWKTIFILIFLASINYNCAFTEGTIKASYQNPIVTEKTKKKIVLIFDKSDDSINSFQDGMYREGIRKNGYGGETANMFIEPKGPELLKKILTMELQNAGFEIVPKSANVDLPEMEMEVLQIFMEPEVGFFAGDVVSVVDANVIVKVKNKSYRRRFKGIGETTTLVWTDGFYAISLKRSLEDFSKKSVPAIIKLIEEKSR
jgi:hypothetical protein